MPAEYECVDYKDDKNHDQALHSISALGADRNRVTVEATLGFGLFRKTLPFSRSTEEAQQAWEQLHRELQELNPSAARSLEEGLDETLTVNRLPLEGWLRRTLSTTNPIESAFSVVETVCRRVKCWRQGDHLERWVGSALWVAEGNFRKVKGYRGLPKLVAALENLRPRPPAAQARAA